MQGGLRGHLRFSNFESDFSIPLYDFNEDLPFLKGFHAARAYNRQVVGPKGVSVSL